MWADSMEEDLRQGDLLRAVTLPRLQMPLTYIKAEGEQVTAKTQSVLRQVTRNYVVISQCCTIENGAGVAVAPVRQTGPLTPDQLQAYAYAEPGEIPADAEVSFPFSTMPLDPVVGTLDALPDNRRWIVEFEDAVTFINSKDFFRGHRVAQMTVLARRNLRVRLTWFWGRAVAADVPDLSAAGVNEM